uniref:Homing endonuclease LAGLIDADG domain-containing protein n=1 Tax=Caulerpa verticillata TaxID=177082 RepID=A0A386B090_9CHLO|nr:hypothetical protein [Caulerpa verticillata]AYC65110.1 hypothetical protein [Caulerpa verticillata]
MIKNIPEKYGYYITGFSDGEGSFNISFRKRNDYLIGWKITPVFNISQDEREILAWIKHILKCGTIRFRKDGIWTFEVHNQNALNKIILPFFDRFHFLSKKKKLQYQKFKKICKLLNHNTSITYETICQILILRNESNIKNSKKRKYTDTLILQRAEFYWNKNHKIIQSKNNKKSSETNTPKLFL